MIFSEEVITSKQNTMVKWAASLSQKKAREETKSFLAEGEKLTFEALSARLPVTHILVREDRKEEIFARLRATECAKEAEGCRVLLIGSDAFDKISTENSPQGVISIIKYLDFFKSFDIIYNSHAQSGEESGENPSFLLPGERALALCSLRDPGNLGSVIRSAVAFGVTHLLLTADCADLYHPKTVRSAMGSLFRVKATVLPDAGALMTAIQKQGRRALCAELRPGAVALSEISLRADDVVVIGNEGHGIPEEASALASASVYIPISERTESLNASVAAALFMWEQSKV